MASTFRRSPLALAILGLLENGPMHPYGIQRLIKQWGKDQVVNVGQRASLYRMIDRLEGAGLITASGTDRDERYPERTKYEITDAGRAATRRWLDEIVSTPRNEFPEFPAALSFLMMLTPADAQRLLERRRDRLVEALTELDKSMAAQAVAKLPRVAMIEDEYRKAVIEAEARWVDATLEALADGSLKWAGEDFVPFGVGNPAR